MRPFLIPLRVLLAAALLSMAVHSSWAQTAPATSVVFSNEVEASLVRTLETLKEGSIQAALHEIDLALEKNPNFRLGHLIKGDLLMAQSGAPVAFFSGNYAGRTPQPEMVASLRLEAKARLTRYFDGPPLGHLPTALLQLAPQQEYALLMDSEKSRLYIFRNVDGAPQLVTDFYISAGKNGVDKEREGDQRTPLGVYTINPAVAKERLSDFYGPGAFPLNFPNEWDKRLGKTGSGIWLHGTPSTTYSRPPRASDGCVVLTNDDFESIKKYVDPGVTPIVITPSVEWRSPDQWLDMRAAFDGALEGWQHDWESLDTDKYLNHYSPHFSADGKGFADWSALKRRINAAKSFVKVGISNLSIFEYPLSPTTPPMMIVTFDQDYRSSNNSSKMKKRQYWQREKGQWKIVYEAAAS
ncbi:MAG TPA: L,D-transpeptidase family protein [Usitatibacteraceae bacterium]